MNDLIKQLEPQCWEHNEFGLNFNYQKFAELIVRECIAQAVKEEERYDLFGSRDAGYCSTAMANFQGVLAEHFGVEQ